MRKAFYHALRQRLPIKRACELVGIGHKSYARWMNYGKEPDKYGVKFKYFRDTVLKLKSEKEADALKVIELIQNGGHTIRETKIVVGGKYGRTITKTTKELIPNWQAAAWFLERTKPGDYGQHRVDSDEAKTPDEIANEIQQALTAMDETVPDCCHTEIMECEDNGCD